MRRLALAALVLAAACRASAPEDTAREFAHRLTEEVEFDRWAASPSNLAMYAGFDILDGTPPELGEWQLAQDDFEYDGADQVVLRSLRWRRRGVPLSVVCGVGMGSADLTHRALLEQIALRAPAGIPLKRDPAAPLIRVTAQDPRAFTAFCRGNIFIVLSQPAEILLDPAPVLAEWDRRIQAQPPLLQAMQFVPRIRDVRCSRKSNVVKKGSEIKFTLSLEGEEGFVPAGIEIVETKRRQSYRLHSSALHLGVTANAEGTFTLCLWVANQRQLAGVSYQKIIVN